MCVHCAGIDSVHHTCIMQNAQRRARAVFTGQAHHKSLILLILPHAPFTADGFGDGISKLLGGEMHCISGMFMFI